MMRCSTRSSATWTWSGCGMGATRRRGVRRVTGDRPCGDRPPRGQAPRMYERYMSIPLAGDKPESDHRKKATARRSMNHLTLTITSGPEELAERAAGRYLQAAGEAISQSRRFAAALSGGSTPEKLYNLLAQPGYAARIDWPLFALFLGDERFVPLDDSRSNC